LCRIWHDNHGDLVDLSHDHRVSEQTKLQCHEAAFIPVFYHLRQASICQLLRMLAPYLRDNKTGGHQYEARNW